ncbi:Cell division control protein 25, partial [Pseudocercospora fuligena]
LSSLVQIAKRLQETIGEPFAGEVVHVLLDDLICKAFKVVTRAVSFTDVWTQETGNDSLRLSMYGKPVLEAPLEIDTEMSASKDVAGPIDSAKHLPEPDVHEDASHEPQNERQSIDEKAPRHSMVFTPPDGVVAHRLSTITKDKVLTGPGSLASEQLANAHDVCISHIGAFIGYQLHARDASELVATTERLVKACRSMLAIIDEVYSHDPQASLSVQQAKNDFEVKIEELAKSTQGVFRFSENPEDDIIMLPGQTDQLINIGTSMVSNIGSCVVKTRQLIEQIGDFELKSAGTQTARSSREIQPEQSMPSPEELSEQEVKFENRQSIDMKLMPPPAAPPPVPEEARTVVDADSPLASPAEAKSPTEELNKDLPPLPLSIHRRSIVRASQASSIHGVESLKSPRNFRSDSISPARKDSFGISIAGSTETFFSSTRDSSMTAASQASTRATTPEQSKDSTSPDPAMMNSFASLSSMRSLVTEDSLDVEAQLLQKSYANELTFNKEGQVTGGSLPALVEQLTTHDVAPDPQFVTAFFLTFRRFAEPREFAQALISRFEYIGDSRTVGTPVRLRIYNVFKGWLETYWSAEADKDALGEIRFFALHKLKQVLPTAGDRLIELTRRITEGYSNGTISGPMVSGVGKSSMSISTQTLNDIPDAIITTRQLNALRLATGGGAQCSIMDFEPVEIARQITLLVAKTYCEIRPEELINMEWTKANTKKAKNVRKMGMLNTDLAHFVADTILSPDSPKARAAMIKQWVKVGLACLELNNYDSVMSIMCSINSSPVQRLKKTWDLVSKKTKARLDELDKVTDMSKNYNSLRRRLEAPTAPCLPFLGVYLTDLTFVHAGNPKKRHVPGSMTESGELLSVINFDMYTRIAKIISHLQKFQVPYRLKAVPEMQTWMEVHLARMREGHDDMVGTLHRRSLFVEPKDKDGDRKHSIIPGSLGDERPKTSMTSHHSVDRLDFFHRNISFSLKSSSSNLSTPDAEPSKRSSAQ